MWVRRLQVPMSPAFALTEYKVQGSTYAHAVLDLSRPSMARGKDAAHNRYCSVYVQMTRMGFMKKLRLLQPVKLSDFANRMHPELVEEDLRLQRLAAVTIQLEGDASTAMLE
jgi:hypothetical protein